MNPFVALDLLMLVILLQTWIPFKIDRAILTLAEQQQGVIEEWNHCCIRSPAAPAVCNGRWGPGKTCSGLAVRPRLGTRNFWTCSISLCLEYPVWGFLQVTAGGNLWGIISAGLHFGQAEWELPEASCVGQDNEIDGPLNCSIV